MYVLEIKSRVWQQLQYKGKVPNPRSGCKGVSDGFDIYYFGGYTFKKGEYFSDLYRFDVKSLRFSLVYQSKEIQPRVDHSLVINNKQLYIFGGSDGKNKFDDLYCYDMVKVIKLVGDGDQPSGRFGHTAEVYRNQMYIFGGWNG